MCPIVNVVLVSLCNIVLMEDNWTFADDKLDIWETYVSAHLYRSEIVGTWHKHMDLNFQKNKEWKF